MKACLAFADQGALPFQDIPVIIGSLASCHQVSFQKLHPGNTAWDLGCSFSPRGSLPSQFNYLAG